MFDTPRMCRFEFIEIHCKHKNEIKTEVKMKDEDEDLSFAAFANYIFE